MAGYSATPLPKKLGLRDGQRVLFVGLPEPLRWLAGSAAFAEVRVAPKAGRPKRLDVAHVFATEARVLAAALAALHEAIRPAGMIWVSWPKKSAKVPTDVTEDVIRSVALPRGLVDVKVCAVDEMWSGLKLVIRKELR